MAGFGTVLLTVSLSLSDSTEGILSKKSSLRLYRGHLSGRLDFSCITVYREVKGSSRKVGVDLATAYESLDVNSFLRCISD